MSFVGKKITDNEFIDMIPKMDDIPVIEEDKFSEINDGFVSFYKSGVCYALLKGEIKSIMFFLKPDDEFDRYNGCIFDFDDTSLLTFDIISNKLGGPVSKSKEGGVLLFGEKIFWAKFKMENCFFRFEYDEKKIARKVILSSL